MNGDCISMLKHIGIFSVIIKKIVIIDDIILIDKLNAIEETYVVK